MFLNATLCLLIALLLSEVSSEITGLQKTQIRTFIENTKSCYQVPGISLAVVKGNHSWTVGFGDSDLAGTNVTSQTKFCIGSVTKSMTTSLMSLLLAQNSKYSWDTPAVELLPELKWNETWLTDHLTLRDLVSHSLGMPRHDVISFAGGKTSKEDIATALPYLNRTAQIRTKFMYNNNAYAAAGLAAERIGGDTWENLMQRYLWNEIGIKDAKFIDRAYPSFDGISDSFLVRNGTVEKMDMSGASVLGPIGPAGTVCTSADDMATYLTFHLDANHSTIANASAVDDVYKSAMLNNRKPRLDISRPKFPVTYSSPTYGLGVFLGHYRGYKQVQHGGSIMSFSSLLSLLPEEDIGVFVSINGPMGQRTGTYASLVSMYVMDVLLGEGPWLNASSACSFPEPWHENDFNLKPQTFNRDGSFARDPQEYVGTFGNFGMGLINTSYDEGRKTLQLRYGKIGVVNLWPTDEERDSFEMEWTGDLASISQSDVPDKQNATVLNFVTNADDVITGINATLLDPANPVLYVKNLNFAGKPDYSNDPCADNMSSGGGFFSFSLIAYLVCGILSCVFVRF